MAKNIHIYCILAGFLLVSGCQFGDKDVFIQDVTKETSWMYDPPFRGVLIKQGIFNVLIDGKLDNDAILETQHRIFGPGKPYKPEDKVILNGFIKLPTVRFHMALNFDAGSAKKFIFHPLKARRGWLRVQIIGGVPDPNDKSRTKPSWLPGGGMKIMPESDL